MYFIKIKPLKERLINRSMSDREALPYYLVFWACISVAGWATMPPQTTHWHMINNWVGLLIILGGTVFTFNKNGGKTGYDFIQKSVVLGWVITVRLVPLILCGVIGVVLFKLRRGLPDDQTSWADVIFVAVFMIIYYQRLGRHIQDTNRIGEQCPPPTTSWPCGPLEGLRQWLGMSTTIVPTACCWMELLYRVRLYRHYGSQAFLNHVSESYFVTMYSITTFVAIFCAVAIVKGKRRSSVSAAVAYSTVLVCSVAHMAALSFMHNHQMLVTYGEFAQRMGP